MSRLPRISYYAHHMGSGHLRHARRIVETRMFDVQVASTGPMNQALLPEGTNYVPLASDILENHAGEITAGGYFHYAPADIRITKRFSTLNQAWYQFAPDLVMVDVSVEVAIFARLSGYRVALRRMPGQRTDQAHELGYGIADALFAYYPESIEEASHLQRYGSKSYYLPSPDPVGYSDPGPRTSFPREASRKVAVQTSLGAAISLDEIARAAASAPSWSWDVLGSVQRATGAMPDNLRSHGTVSNPEQWMADADVIITSTGHNAVVAAASCRKPALLIPEERPFGEQMAYARMLHRATGYPMLDSWNTPVDWNALLPVAASKNPDALAMVLFGDHDGFADALHGMVASVTKHPC